MRFSVIFYSHHHQHFYLSLFIIKIPVWLGPNRYMYSQSYLFLARGGFQDTKYRAAALSFYLYLLLQASGLFTHLGSSYLQLFRIYR